MAKRTETSHMTTPQTTTEPTNGRVTATRSTRSRSMRLGALAIVVTVLVAACNVHETKMTELVAAERAGAGAQPLTENMTLYGKAYAWAQKMAADGTLSHSNLPDGNPYAWKSLGENVGYGCNVGIEAIHAALMNSPGHRANIMNPKFNQWAVAVYEVGNCLWVVQEFMEV